MTTFLDYEFKGPTDQARRVISNWASAGAELVGAQDQSTLPCGHAPVVMLQAAEGRNQPTDALPAVVAFLVECCICQRKFYTVQDAGH